MRFEDRDLSGGKNCHGDKSAATFRELGSLFGSSERKIRYACEFAKAVDGVKEVKPEVAEKVFRGEVKDAITALPQIMEREEPEIVSEALEKVAEGEEEIKKAVIEVEIQKLKEKAEKMDPPSGKYDVIVVDPSWPYNTEYDLDGHIAQKNAATGTLSPAEIWFRPQI